MVWVMKDENNNGLSDDTWYELAGSDYFFSNTIKNYQLTYTNPNSESAQNIPWSDNQNETGYILCNEFHPQSYYPLNDSFPDINANSYTLSGTKIQANIDTSNSSFVKSYRRAFGYADNQIRGASPYDVPDNPYTWEVENSGGDAFDIHWAVNSDGDYVDLDIIHFVKVQSAVLENAGWLGEISSDITGAIDIAPNTSLVGEENMLVLKDFPDTISSDTYQLEAFAFNLGRWDESAQINWKVDMDDVTIDDNNVMHLTKSGKLVLTATLESNPSITAVDSVIIVNAGNNSISSNSAIMQVNVYPNPASDQLFIAGIDN
ncbi:MAG: hypothetical protein MI739_02155, partial [Bacteroidales bacterium]|nr:hypothetical protein [Bacteroidales bacterium]